MVWREPPPTCTTAPLKDLEALVYQWVKTDRMGKGSHLTEDELNDLIRFLETL